MLVALLVWVAEEGTLVSSRLKSGKAEHFRFQVALLQFSPESVFGDMLVITETDDVRFQLSQDVEDAALLAEKDLIRDAKLLHGVHAFRFSMPRGPTLDALNRGIPCDDDDEAITLLPGFLQEEFVSFVDAVKSPGSENCSHHPVYEMKI